jgi:hypothetical protein
MRRLLLTTVPWPPHFVVVSLIALTMVSILWGLSRTSTLHYPLWILDRLFMSGSFAIRLGAIFFTLAASLRVMVQWGIPAWDALPPWNTWPGWLDHAAYSASLLSLFLLWWNYAIPWILHPLDVYHAAHLRHQQQRWSRWVRRPRLPAISPPMASLADLVHHYCPYPIHFLPLPQTAHQTLQGQWDGQRILIHNALPDPASWPLVALHEWAHALAPTYTTDSWTEEWIADWTAALVALRAGWDVTPATLHRLLSRDAPPRPIQALWIRRSALSRARHMLQ